MPVKVYTLTNRVRGRILAYRSEYLDHPMLKNKNQRKIPADYLTTIRCNKCESELASGEDVVSRRTSRTWSNVVFYHKHCATQLNII